MLNREDWIMIRKMRDKVCYLREIAASVGCSSRHGSNAPSSGWVKSSARRPGPTMSRSVDGGGSRSASTPWRPWTGFRNGWAIDHRETAVSFVSYITFISFMSYPIGSKRR